MSQLKSLDLYRNMFNETTKALLDAHMRECKEDRERTTAQFDAVSRKLDKVEMKSDHQFEITMRSNDERQAQSNAKFDRLFRMFWMAAGVGATISTLSSSWGQKLLLLLMH